METEKGSKREMGSLLLSGRHSICSGPSTAMSSLLLSQTWEDMLFPEEGDRAQLNGKPEPGRADDEPDMKTDPIT